MIQALKFSCKWHISNSQAICQCLKTFIIHRASCSVNPSVQQNSHNRKAAGSPKKNKTLITCGINSHQQIIVAANSGAHDDIRPFRATSNSEANHRASAEEKRLCCKIRAPSGCQTFSCSQCGKTCLSYVTIMNY